MDEQTALGEANAGLAADKRINFRVGVHIGDVMMRAGDLFGDSVNIAARLQSIAKPGALGSLAKIGHVWPETERKLWLQLLEGSFRLIYKDADPKKSLFKKSQVGDDNEEAAN